MEIKSKTEYLVANVQNPANPKESKLFIVAPADVCEFVSTIPQGCVVMFQSIEAYEARK